MIEEARGNLLAADAEALVNTVNTVGIMAKGIALQFKRAFPDNFKEYEAAAENGQIRIGDMFVHRTSALDNPKYIVNFPTKKHWKSRSKLSDIELGLQSLREVIARLGVKSIALPPLGWRPRMTPDHAALMIAFERYLQRSIPGGLSDTDALSIVEAQKAAYFLQVAGWDSKLDFAPSHYGPYAQTVDWFISHTEGHFIFGYGDGSTGSKATLRLDKQALSDAHALMDDDSAYQLALRRFVDIIDGFEFPYGVELLSTVHYVVDNYDTAPSIDQVVTAIKAWSSRKGKIFDREQAALAYNHLAQLRGRRGPPVSLTKVPVRWPSAWPNTNGSQSRAADNPSHVDDAHTTVDATGLVDRSPL
jgi:O-acetyl-ADP-ribose deacetylase (regulator of RNase III)